MTYESWRISYQSSESAARAAYTTVAKLHAENEKLKALVWKCEEVIERYTTREQDTMNGSFRVCCSTRPNEPHSNCDAQEALAAIKEIDHATD